MGPVDSLCVTCIDATEKFCRREEGWRKPRVCRSVRYHLVWSSYHHTKFQTSWWKHFFFQSLCVLGYCVLPLNIAMLICRLLLLAGQGPINFMIRLFVVLVMFAWSVIASTAFLADCQPPNRKALAVYPVFFYSTLLSVG